LKLKENYELDIDINKLFNFIINNCNYIKQKYINESGYCYNILYKYSRLYYINKIINKFNIIYNLLYIFNERYKDILRYYNKYIMSKVLDLNYYIRYGFNWFDVYYTSYQP